jgi:hypothetical protein
MDAVLTAATGTRRKHGVFVAALLVIAVLGIGLRQFVFRYEFTADDYAQLGMMEGIYPVKRAPLSLFTFSDGSEREVQALAHDGFYPWFTHERLGLSMLRPLSSALMWVDHALFGRAALGYHLHSALWWLALLGVLAVFLRRLFELRMTLIALALFALDEAHGVILGWIANRNAIVSTLFSLLALSSYVARRERRITSAGWAAVLMFAVALLAGEYALCLFCFFLAYELIAARDAPGARMRAILPLALLALTFLAIRSAFGFGATGSDMYLDPLRAPAFFVRHAPQRLPVLVGDLMLAIRADWWVFGSPWLPDLVRRGVLDVSYFADAERWRTLQTSVGCGALVLALAVAVPAFGKTKLQDAHGVERRHHAAWIVLGGFLSLFPLLPTFPSTRSLVAPLIGWSVLMALLAERAITALTRASGARLLSRVAAVAALGFVALHLVYDAWSAPIDAEVMARNSTRAANIALGAELDDARLPRQRVITLQSVDQGTTIYFSLVRQLHGLHGPETHWTLSPSILPYVLTRPGVAALEIALPSGELLTSTYESIFRTLEAPVSVGQTFARGGLLVTILETRGGGASRVLFSFDRPLEDPSLVFLISSARGMVRFYPPPVGGRVEIPLAPQPLL